MSKVSPVPTTTGRTLADFRSAHDRNVIVPAKIKKAIEEMVAENVENWDYEIDFMRRAGISQTDIGMFRAQFQDHIVEVGGKNPKKVWFASVKVAEKARGK